MKVLSFAILFLSCVQTFGSDRPQVLMFIDGNNTPLARAISAEPECSGVYIAAFMGGQKADWAMAQRVGDGHGRYQIWLEDMHSNKDTFLGTNVTSAAKQACRIIKQK